MWCVNYWKSNKLICYWIRSMPLILTHSVYHPGSQLSTWCSRLISSNRNKYLWCWTRKISAISSGLLLFVFCLKFMSKLNIYIFPFSTSSFILPLTFTDFICRSFTFLSLPKVCSKLGQIQGCTGYNWICLWRS